MKVIDLLNKIANNIDVPPKQIKYDDKIFEYKLWLEPNKYAYVEIGKNNTLEEYCCFYDLNEEIKIIEDKKIEKLEHMNSRDYLENRDEYLSTKDIALDIESLRLWINKIIDKLNEGQE